MQTKDEFRREQKTHFPPDRGSRKGKQAIYGCPCCRDGNLSDLKRWARRQARRRIKQQKIEVED